MLVQVSTPTHAGTHYQKQNIRHALPARKSRKMVMCLCGGKLTITTTTTHKTDKKKKAGRAPVTSAAAAALQTAAAAAAAAAATAAAVLAFLFRSMPPLKQ